MTSLVPHHYIDRQTGKACRENLFNDAIVNTLYNGLAEKAPHLFRLLTSPRTSQLLSLYVYDWPFAKRRAAARMASRLGIDLDECLDKSTELRSARQLFERRIRYWRCRPMPANPKVIVSPADAKLLVGSFRESSQLFLKNKFFEYTELFGRERITG